LEAWRRDTERPLANSLIVRGLLPASGRDIADSAHWASVRGQVEQAAVALDQSAAGAPTEAASIAAAGSAAALRALVSSLESERLLLEGSQALTTAQTSAASQSVSARNAELDAALTRLENQVRPAEALQQ
jgi:hypothetical protein